MSEGRTTWSAAKCFQGNLTAFKKKKCQVYYESPVSTQFQVEGLLWIYF